MQVQQIVKYQMNKEKLLEIELIRKMKKSPSDEVAAELLSLYVKHKIKKTKISKELRNYINSFFIDLKSDEQINKISAMVNKIGRPSYEHKHIAMNASTWRSIFTGSEISKAYQETAKIFKTDCDTPRRAFERKSHDFGKRELCRIGLDVFVVVSNYKFTPLDKKIAADILKEPILEQMHKDEEHIKNKYKDLINQIIEKMS